MLNTRRLLYSVLAATLLVGAGCANNTAPETSSEAKSENNSESKSAKKESTEARKQKANGAPVVKQWNFVELPMEQWEWQFPGKAEKRPDYGALYQMKELAAPGPELLGVNRPATEFNTVRIHVITEDRSRLDDGIIGARLPVRGVQLQWARKQDVAAAGGESPYTAERTVPMVHDPNTRYDWVRDVSRHKLWDGEIDRIRVWVRVDDEAAVKEGYNVVIRRASLRQR